jgi:hypothetical protein
MWFHVYIKILNSSVIGKIRVLQTQPPIWLWYPLICNTSWCNYRDLLYVARFIDINHFNEIQMLLEEVTLPKVVSCLASDIVKYLHTVNPEYFVRQGVQNISYASYVCRQGHPVLCNLVTPQSRLEETLDVFCRLCKWQLPCLSLPMLLPYHMNGP